jgi:hypothetical protein
MGSKPSSVVIRVLVIGLSGVGKTHFLDMFDYPNSNKIPTKGYYENTVKYEGFKIHLIEYGGQVEWGDKLCHENFDQIYMFIDERYPIEKMLQANSLMLKMCHLLPGKPLVVCHLHCQQNHLQVNLNDRAVATCHLNFQVAEWQEGCSRLFSWTIKNHQPVV